MSAFITSLHQYISIVLSLTTDLLLTPDTHLSAIKKAIKIGSAATVKAIANKVDAIKSSVHDDGNATRQQMQFYEQIRQKDRDDDRRHYDENMRLMNKRFDELKKIALTPFKGESPVDTAAPPEVIPIELSSLDASKSTDLTTEAVSKSSSVSLGELNKAKDQLKEAKEKNKALEQDLRSKEVELKQEKERSRALTATKYSKKLAATVRNQPPSETTEKSMNKHSARISGALSVSKSRRSVLDDETQTIANPAPRRSARLDKNKSN